MLTLRANTSQSIRNLSKTGALSVPISPRTSGLVPKISRLHCIMRIHFPKMQDMYISFYEYWQPFFVNITINEVAIDIVTQLTVSFNEIVRNQHQIL